MTTLAVLLFLHSAFVVDVSTTTSYRLDIPRERLRTFVDDIGLFARHMPSVVRVTPLTDSTYRYETEKKLPLAGTLATTFIIVKRTLGDSLTVYESVNPDDANYMYCSVSIQPDSPETTLIGLTLRLRLSRDNPFSIHWMAPLVGERFIAVRMKEDMDEMLKEFIRSSSAELYNRLLPRTLNR
jgi:hypothetical protein